MHILNTTIAPQSLLLVLKAELLAGPTNETPQEKGSLNQCPYFTSDTNDENRIKLWTERYVRKGGEILNGERGLSETKFWRCSAILSLSYK